MLLKQHAPQPTYTPKGKIKRDDKLNFAAVRHPFQRSYDFESIYIVHKNISTLNR